MSKKPKKYFNREYTPVVIGAIILVILICALIFIFFYNKEESEPEVTLQEKVYSTTADELAVSNNNSTCSNDELKVMYDEAEKVNITYDISYIKLETDEYVTEEEVAKYAKDLPPEDVATDPDPYQRVIKFDINGLSDDMYLLITNDINEDKVIIGRDDDRKDFYTKDIYTKTIYTVSVKTKNDNCTDDVVRKFTIEPLVYNYFNSNMICTGYTEFEGCAKFVKNQSTYTNFQKNLKKYQEENPDKISDEFVDYTQTDKNKNDEANRAETIKSIIIVSVIAVILIIVVVILLKKKRSRE